MSLGFHLWIPVPITERFHAISYYTYVVAFYYFDSFARYGVQIFHLG